MLDKLTRVAGMAALALAVVGVPTRPTVDWELSATALIMGGTNGAIHAAASSSSGPIVAVGLSEAAQLMDDELWRLAGQAATDPASAPPADQLSFVLLGDTNRSLLGYLRGLHLPILDYTLPPVPETPYDVTVVAGEYDEFADSPDRPWNLLAVANAIAGSGYFPGFGSVHYDSLWADLSEVPQENITTSVNSQGGVTTTYIVPTPDLPLLRPLPGMGVPQQVVDTLNTALRPIVDLGYRRSAEPGNDQKDDGQAGIGRHEQPCFARPRDQEPRQERSRVTSQLV